MVAPPPQQPPAPKPDPVTPTLIIFPNAKAALGLGGIIQPSLVWFQQDDNAKPVVQNNSGFILRHTRLYFSGALDIGNVQFDLRVEGELMPQFQLLDAYIGVGGELPKDGHWRIALGQMFAPFSRQTMLSTADFQLPLPAALTTLTPGRQVGITGQLNVPGAQWIEISAGAYNGEGVNVVQNVDSNFMLVGRLAFRPIGPRARMIEGGMGPDAVSVAGNVSYNVKNLGDSDETTLLVGADAFFSRWGLSAYAEYLYGQVTYAGHNGMMPTQANYKEQALNIQAGYLLPIPGYLYRRIEVVGRFEEIAPNDVILIQGPGDPNQARSSIVAGLNYYQRGHSLKAQLAYYHNQQQTDKDRNGMNALYNDDMFIFQLTGRLEVGQQ